MRIITKQEVYTESKCSLAGTSAIRMYVDGNITISVQASEFMNLRNYKHLLLAVDKKNEYYLVPNNKEGYTPTRRKNKYTYLMNSKPLVTYLSNAMKIDVKPRKPMVAKLVSGKKLEGMLTFHLQFNKNN